MCPTDFIMEENEFDSDGVFYKNENTHSMEKLMMKDLVYTASSSTKEKTPPLQEDISFILDNENELQKETCYEEDIIEHVNNIEVAKKTADKYKDHMQTPQRPRIIVNGSEKRRKAETSHKAALIKSNMEMKENTFKLLEEEHALKMHFQKQELCHQELRHKLEIDILILEKEKKELEIKLLKQKFM